MNEGSSNLVIEMAKTVVDLVRVIEPNWEKAFFRYESDGSYDSASGSYLKGGDATIFDVLAHRSTFTKLKGCGGKLRDALEKDGVKFVVCLLTVDSSFHFDVTYEYEKVDRWKISKTAGGSGLPE